MYNIKYMPFEKTYYNSYLISNSSILFLIRFFICIFEKRENELYKMIDVFTLINFSINFLYAGYIIHIYLKILYY